MRLGSRVRLLGIAIALAVVLVLVADLGWGTVHAGPYNPCAKPGNLAYNCGFDEFTEDVYNGKRLQFPKGWWYYVVAGEPDFRKADDTYWGAPSLEIMSDGVPFTAGIYQQTQVTPGVVYQADMGWSPAGNPQNVVRDWERKVGLDPTGGTDPQAPTVIWGPNGGDLEDKWPDLTVSARALGSNMTLFVWVRHWASYGQDAIYLDAVGLWPDPNQPPATVTPNPSLTPTRRPPTRTPQPAPPTPTATVLPAIALPTETPLPTETATSLPTPTWTVTASPLPPTTTPLPTATPTRTAVPVARVLPSAARPAEKAARTKSRGDSPGGAFLYVAAGALSGAVMLGVAGVGLWARARKKAD